MPAKSQGVLLPLSSEYILNPTVSYCLHHYNVSLSYDSPLWTIVTAFCIVCLPVLLSFSTKVAIVIFTRWKSVQVSPLLKKKIILPRFSLNLYFVLKPLRDLVSVYLSILLIIFSSSNMQNLLLPQNIISGCIFYVKNSLQISPIWPLLIIQVLHKSSQEALPYHLSESILILRISLSFTLCIL